MSTPLSNIKVTLGAVTNPVPGTIHVTIAIDATGLPVGKDVVVAALAGTLVQTIHDVLSGSSLMTEIGDVMTLAGEATGLK